MLCLRQVIFGLIMFVSIFNLDGQTRNVVIADSTSSMPLPNASVFDSQGKIVGICDERGVMPYISKYSFPITIRYLGFCEKVVNEIPSDTIFLRESFAELPEVIVESRKHKVLHMLAYVREYSTLSTYTDTVFMFREKMVDFMIPPENSGFKGYRNPRILKSKSYYRFTDSEGLDSVSDECRHYFSWSDWIGVITPPKIGDGLKNVAVGTDTLMGKYSPTEVWTKNNDRVTIDVNVLADTVSRKWVPNLSIFFRNNLDFENFRLRYNYDNVVGDSISLIDLTGYSFNIESNGRGRDMFRFNKVDESFCVSTYTEVYILDKEYITEKEAKKWGKHNFKSDEIEIYEPADAPCLQPSILALVDRVNDVNHNKIRLAIAPDRRLVGRGVVRQNIGQRVLQLFKMATGISRYRAKKNWERQWNDMRQERMKQKRDSEKDD